MKRIATLMLVSAGVVMTHSVASAQACSRVATFRRYDMTDAGGILARALADTRHRLDNGSGIFDNTVRDVSVCLDSIPFLSSWTTERVAPLVELAPVNAALISNSAYPRSMNDGVLWAGKGVNTTVSAGARAHWRFLSAAVQPIFAYQQNADHVYVRASRTGMSPFTNPDHLIDLPLRFGDKSFTTFDAGQSFVRADYGPLSAAFSNENLWLGASQVYPLILSNTAPGFPHVRVGTSRPVNLRVVDAELNIFFGSVRESKYFDGDPTNDSHLFTGTSLVLEPHVLRGLHLGIARVYHDTEKAAGHNAHFYLHRIIESPLFISGGNRDGNAIGALFMRWMLPESGFEFYGEFTREDTPYNLADMLREPDWSDAWGGGVQKVMLTPARLTRVYGELVHLSVSAAGVRTGRGPYTNYTHSIVRQGHTNQGQLLGSPSGLGSDAQRIGVDTYAGQSVTGVFFERVRYDDDAYYAEFGREFGEARHQVELTLGLKRMQRIHSFELTGAAILSRRWDRDFISLRNHAPAMMENNVGLQLGVRWLPDR